MDIAKIQEEIENFAKERDWEQFHSPKNLATALMVEGAELLEHFQWLTQEQSTSLNQETINAIAAEIADVQIYLLHLAHKLAIDVEAAVVRKLKDNANKYPAKLVKGSSAKYTEYS